MFGTKSFPVLHDFTFVAIPVVAHGAFVEVDLIFCQPAGITPTDVNAGLFGLFRWLKCVGH